MAVNFFVDIFNGTHCTISDAGNDFPAVIFGGGFSGTAQIEITVFSKGPEGGDGIFKIIDKETSAEVYCSPITFENYAGAWSNITIRFAKPLNLGPWEVDQEHIRWIDEDHIYFYMNLPIQETDYKIQKDLSLIPLEFYSPLTWCQP